MYTFKELPFIVIGSISLIASYAAWLLPETKGKLLPNTIEDVEEKQTGVDIELTGEDFQEKGKIIEEMY